MRMKLSPDLSEENGRRAGRLGRRRASTCFAPTPLPGIDNWKESPSESTYGRIFPHRGERRKERPSRERARCGRSGTRSCFSPSSRGIPRRTIRSTCIAAWARNPTATKGIQTSDLGCLGFSTSIGPMRARPIATRYAGALSDIGIAITELSTHLQGQMVSVHPAYDLMFDGHARHRSWRPREAAPLGCRSGAQGRARVAPLRTDGARHLTGSLAWPYFYPYPQRPEGLIEECFAEQGRRWKPILDVFDETASISASRSIRPRTSSMARPSKCSSTPSAATSAATSITTPATTSSNAWTISASSTPITIASRCSMSRTPSSIPPRNRASMAATRAGSSAGRTGRSATGKSISRGFLEARGLRFAGWAVYEWEDRLQHPEVAARKGAQFIADHIIEGQPEIGVHLLFAATGADHATNLKLLGIRG